MGIRLENINYKKDDGIIFKDLNIAIPYNKIIGLYGDKLDDFIEFLIHQEFNTGKIIDDEYYLKKVKLIDNYNGFITNFVKDELYINIKYNLKNEEEIEKILNKFSLNKDFLSRSINTLSNFEKKLLHVIISMFNNKKIIIFKDLFNGLDYHNKSLFVRLLKNIKKNFNKIIFIFDNDMDTIDNLVDRLLIVDSNLVLIDKIEDIFNNDDINKVKIEWPNFIKIKKILKDKGINIENVNNINDLIGK